jgi:hypothetical protein
MKAYKVETVLDQDGQLTLRGLPFHSGAVLEIIILERDADEISVDKQDDEQTYLVGVSNLITEWDSEGDELAYGNLFPVLIPQDPPKAEAEASKWYRNLSYSSRRYVTPKQSYSNGEVSSQDHHRLYNREIYTKNLVYK